MEDECGFIKIKISSNLRNREPWVNVDTITQVFYHPDSEDEDWSFVVDVEGRGYLETITEPELALNEPIVEKHIRNLARGTTPNNTGVLGGGIWVNEEYADKVMVAITVNEAFLEVNVADTLRNLESEGFREKWWQWIERKDLDANRNTWFFVKVILTTFTILKPILLFSNRKNSFDLGPSDAPEWVYSSMMLDGKHGGKLWSNIIFFIGVHVCKACARCHFLHNLVYFLTSKGMHEYWT